MFSWVLGRYVASTILLVPKLSEVDGQLRGDEECPLSGVTRSGGVWRKVPESDARSVDLQARTYIYILDYQLRAMREKHFFFFFFFFSLLFLLLLFGGGATCGVSVRNGGLTESTASIYYLHVFLIKKKK